MQHIDIIISHATIIDHTERVARRRRSNVRWTDGDKCRLYSVIYMFMRVSMALDKLKRQIEAPVLLLDVATEHQLVLQV